MRRQGVGENPVLIGAGAILIALVMVLVSYNANEGLPFVPTYDITAEVPNGASVVTGNDVRIGGARVGLATAVTPKRRADGSTYAVLSLKLDEKIGPIPRDSKIIVRPRSTIGLKYIELTLGSSKAVLPDGGNLPIENSVYASEFEDLFNTFDERVREGNRRNLIEFGNAFAGRGIDLNTAFGELAPLFERLEPVARTVSDPAARLGDFIVALAQAAGDTAPVAGEAGEVFANADRTFAALATATQGIQDTLAEAPETLSVVTEEFPKQRPYLRQITRLTTELSDGAPYLPQVASDLATITTKGTPALGHLKRSGPKFDATFNSLGAFASDPLVQLGVKGLSRFAQVINEPLAYVTPAQTVCNYAGLFARNLASVTGQRDGGISWLRFSLIAGFPNTPGKTTAEIGPAGTPADVANDRGNSDNRSNFLHSNPYPYTASPGQSSTCAAGNEVTLGRDTINRPRIDPAIKVGNPTLPSGTKTEDTEPVKKELVK